MSNFKRQSLKKENIYVWKVFIIMVLAIVAMNYIMIFFRRINPILNSSVGLLFIVGASLLSYKIIHDNMMAYNFKIISNDLILERAIGRANYIVFTVAFNEIVWFEKLEKRGSTLRLPKGRRLYLSKKNDNLYLIEYKKEDNREYLAVQFEQEFLEGVLDNLKDGEQYNGTDF